jgi:hypothetical protein
VIAAFLAFALAGQAGAGSPAAGPLVPAAPVTVTATAGKPEVTLGEVFTVEVKASGPAGASYTFPGEAADDTVDLRTQVDDARAAAALPGVHRYRASVFSLGQARIPPISVRYRLADGKAGEAASAPLDLRVVSLLSKDPQQQKLSDIRGPLPVGIGRAFWAALAIVVVCAAALVTWVLRARRRKASPTAAPVPPLPPDVEARRALDALAGTGLLARGEYRAFYIQLTAVAKRYLERRLSAPVLEMTSAETLAFLRAHPHGGDLLTTVRDVAEAADRIKFARGEGLAAEAERHLASLRALVTTLEDRLRPPAAEAEGRAA